MKIGIDARMDRTGIGRYTFSLIRELAGIDHQTAYVVFLRREAFDAFDVPGPNFQKRLADVPHYSGAEQLRLPMILHREQLDLVHFPNFNVPLLTRCPYVVTIYDLTLSAHSTRRGSASGAVRHALKRAGYQTVIRAAAARARHILTMSEVSRQAIAQRLAVDPSRITVTPGGVDLSRFGSTDAKPAERFGITQPYILYVGAAYPHKNLARLIEAFASFNQRSQIKHQLVLAGEHDGFGSTLRALAGRLVEKNAVVFPGRITDSELATLYGQAIGYAFVSLAEGFGLPGLEAMAHGVPVLAARAGSLPEIYGDAALYVDPENVSAIAAGLAALALDPRLRAELVAKGRAQVAKYSWRRMAEQTLEVYRAAVGRG